MKECSKSIHRRLADPAFLTRYFVGEGLDIGGKPDPLALHRPLFPFMGSVRTWDLEDGDAQLLASLPDQCIDFVHSSHCLEHLIDPLEGLKNWFRVLRPGGHLVVTVPDEDLYEQGVFPSTFNRDHKWTFTIFKRDSWCARSLNVLDMLRELDEAAEVLRVEQLSSSYRFDVPRVDQTLGSVAECGIEFVLRRRPAEEVAARGRWQRTSVQPDAETRRHINQQAHDMATLKAANRDRPPFLDDGPI